jgi:hypothetical protein
VISQRPAQLQADCKQQFLLLLCVPCLTHAVASAHHSGKADKSGNSFAFVEYEDRRDADDAYHEMHNKRIGRDDVLKIEVRSRTVAGMRTKSRAVC